MRRPILGLALALLPQALGAVEWNWLEDPALSSAQAWQRAPERAQGPSDAPAAASLEQQGAGWLAYRQVVPLAEPAPALLELSAWMRTRGVKKGGQAWELARVTLVFQDAAGHRVGDWPAAAAEALGDSAWRPYAHAYAVPEGARQVEVSLLLDHCSGWAAWAGAGCH